MNPEVIKAIQDLAINLKSYGFLVDIEISNKKDKVEIVVKADNYGR